MDLLYRRRCHIRIAKSLRRLRSGQLPLCLHARLPTLPLRPRLTYLAHSRRPGTRSSVESLGPKLFSRKDAKAQRKHQNASALCTVAPLREKSPVGGKNEEGVDHLRGPPLQVVGAGWLVHRAELVSVQIFFLNKSHRHHAVLLEPAI